MRTPKTAATAAALVLTAASPAMAQIQSLMPLDQLIAEDPHAADDLRTVEYIAVRCSALYIAFAKALDNETQADRIRTKEDFKTISSNFMGTANNIEVNTKDKGTDTRIKELPHQVLKLANIYIDRMSDYRLRLGNGMLDPIVKADVSVCQPMARK
jgi:hypothetical protein